MQKNDKIFVAGHRGLIGSAFMRRLIREGYSNIITRERAELDLCDQSQVRLFFEKEKPGYVCFAAGKVGGVFANNTYRADFIYENVMMQCNVIHGAFLSEVKKMLFLSSADVYPKGFNEPMKEEQLLAGPLESTCEPFALSKICGMKMCESYNRQYGTDFIVVVAPNVYGPNQRYDMMNAQVLPSLIKKFHDAKRDGAKEVVIWGTGKPVRDFLFVDDLLDACMMLFNNNAGADVFNVGSGRGYTILELAQSIKDAVGFNGEIVFDQTKPDGVYKKLLETSKIGHVGWKPKTSLLDGITLSYDSFLNELEKKEVRASRIHNIPAGEKDASALAQVRSSIKPITLHKQPESYRSKIVVKPWGYEYIVFENEKTAVWLLFISKGNATSMHCHLEKKTSLIILSGTAMSNTLDARNYLRGGDALILDKGVFHSTKVLSSEGMFLLEIESPPAKTDLVRLEDKYGREASGYEGVAEMKNESLEEHGYFYFEESGAYSEYRHETGDYALLFEVFADAADFVKHFQNDGFGLYTVCRGKLLDGDGAPVLDTGNTQKADILSSVRGIHIVEKTVLMKTFSKDK